MSSTAANIRGTAAAVAGLAAIAGLVYLPVWLHRFDPAPESITKKPAEVIVADVPDATLVGRHNGHRIWRIHARHIEAAADGHTTTFVGIDHGLLYQKDRPAAGVSAGRAVYNDLRRTLRVSQGLTLTAGLITLHTSGLEWSATSSRVACPSPVTATWKGGAATARSLVADTKLRILVGRDVSVVARMEGPMFENVAKRLGAASGASLALFLAAPSPGQPAASAPVKYREVKVTHVDVWRFDQTTKTHTYDGHVTAVHGDTTLHADRIVYREDANTATVTGHVLIDNPRNHVEGDTADVDFNTKLIQLRGANGVRITALPRPDATGARARIKEPVTLVCRSIDYNYKLKRAEAAGPLTVTRKTQTVTGDAATYLGAEDTIDVRGNVHGKDERNQTFDAPSVKLYVKEGAEWMEAPNVRATFFVKDEEETPAPATTQAKP